MTLLGSIFLPPICGRDKDLRCSVSSPYFHTEEQLTTECHRGLLNSLTGNYVLAIVLFGRYIHDLNVGIVEWILLEKNLVHQNLPYNTMHKSANIQIAQKGTILTLYSHHWCSKLQKILCMKEGKLRRLLRIQQAIKLCEQKNWQETIILQSYCRKLAVVTAITS